MVYVAVRTSHWFPPYPFYLLSKSTFLLRALMFWCCVYALCACITSLYLAVVCVRALSDNHCSYRLNSEHRLQPQQRYGRISGECNRTPVPAAEGNCHGSCSHKLHVAFCQKAAFALSVASCLHYITNYLLLVIFVSGAKQTSALAVYLTAVSESMFFRNVFLLVGKISCFFCC